MKVREHRYDRKEVMWDVTGKIGETGASNDKRSNDNYDLKTLRVAFMMMSSLGYEYSTQKSRFSYVFPFK